MRFSESKKLYSKICQINRNFLIKLYDFNIFSIRWIFFSYHKFDKFFSPRGMTARDFWPNLVIRAVG